jgi:hypothetical protein
MVAYISSPLPAWLASSHPTLLPARSGDKVTVATVTWLALDGFGSSLRNAPGVGGEP